MTTTIDDIDVVHLRPDTLDNLYEILDFLGWDLTFEKEDKKPEDILDHSSSFIGHLHDRLSRDQICWKFQSNAPDDKSWVRPIRSMPVLMQSWLKKPGFKHDKMFVCGFCLELLQHGLVWRIGKDKIIKLPKFKSLSELKMKLEIMNGDQKI